MKLNKTKALVEVPTLGSYSPYSYYTNTHPLKCTIFKLKNYQI